MFTVVNELFVTPENRPEFEQNFPASMRGTLPGVPGLCGARLLHPSQQDRGYLSILEFSDEDAYNTYLASDAFRAAHTWPDHAPINSNRLTTYRICTEISPAGGRRPITSKPELS
jgi:heme-degrading monooxygenase HmoA